MGIGLKHSKNRCDQYKDYDNESNSESSKFVDYYIERVKAVAKKHSISFADAILVFNTLEKKAHNWLYIDNGDNQDEDMIVIGEKIDALLEVLNNISTNLEN